MYTGNVCSSDTTNIAQVLYHTDFVEGWSAHTWLYIWSLALGVVNLCGLFQYFNVVHGMSHARAQY